MAQTSPADLEVKWLQNNQRTEYKSPKSVQGQGERTPPTTTTTARGKNTRKRLKRGIQEHMDVRREDIGNCAVFGKEWLSEGGKK